MSDQSSEDSKSSWSKLSKNQKIVTILTIFTAISHIAFSYGWNNTILNINLGVWFVINGIGYLVILYFLYFSAQFIDNIDLFRYLLIAWTIASIIAWALFHTSSDRYNTLLDASLINKSVEVLILLFLYFDIRSQNLSRNVHTIKEMN